MKPRASLNDHSRPASFDHHGARPRGIMFGNQSATNSFPSSPRSGLSRSSAVSRGGNTAPRRQAPWWRELNPQFTLRVTKHASTGTSPVVSGLNSSSSFSNRNSVCSVSSILLLLLGVFTFAGCGGPSDVDSTYGKRRGTLGGSSVNGTAVLAGIFEQAGHNVTTWHRLSPKLKKADVIVWTPDDFQPPTAEQRAWFEEWLHENSSRKLIYVGRDYDAAATYWEKVQTGASAEQASVIARRLASAKADHAAERVDMPKEEYCRWFTMRRDRPARDVRTLQGKWVDELRAAGAPLDALKVEIKIEGRLDVPEEADMPKGETQALPYVETLLQSDGDVLVSRVTDDAWWNGEVIVVANGSFVLNVPLVNHQHRQLAGKLIEECGQPGQQVVFLESGDGGPAILKREPVNKFPSWLDMFTTWPMNVILLHVSVAGIVLCFAVFPIFGRPRELPPEGRSDFAKHIHALGELLARTGDQAYARSRLAYYHQHVKRDSGVSHRDKK